MKRETLISLISRQFLKWVWRIQQLFILALCAAPILYVWIPWSVCWRLAVTGGVGILVTDIFARLVRRAVGKFLDKNPSAVPGGIKKGDAANALDAKAKLNNRK